MRASAAVALAAATVSTVSAKTYFSEKFDSA
jgi:hypothetical protein